MGVNDGRVMASGGGVATEKNRKKNSPKFEICGSVRFFSVFLRYFFGFFRSEFRQEVPAIQKSCQQCGLGRPRTAQ